MNKFAVDYNSLEQDLAHKPRVFRLADVQDKITKVAFDVVKFNDSEGLDGLWKVEKNESGEYIVACYDDSSLTAESSEEAAPTAWKAVASQGFVHVFYKNDPVTKISLASLGLPEKESDKVASFLPNRLANNKKMVSGLLSELNKDDLKNLLTSYPELQD
jgi:hypothetical protein